MTKLSHLSSEHEELVSQLPWLVNGTLERSEAEQLRLHVAGCEVCKDEMAFLNQLQSVVAENSGDVPDTSASFERMRERIAEESASPNVGSHIQAFLRGRLDWLTRSMSRMMEFRYSPVWAATAVCGLAAVLFVTQQNTSVDSIGKSPYQLLSSDEKPDAMEIFVRLDSGLSDTQANTLLNDITQAGSFKPGSWKGDNNTYHFAFKDEKAESALSPPVLSKLVQSLLQKPGVVDVGISP